MLALPGSAYLYQGEELGLHEVADIPAELIQDPAFLRSGGRKRAATDAVCRCPGRLTARRSDSAPVPLTCRSRPGSARSACEAQEHDPTSTLALYRQALSWRRKLQGAESLEFIPDTSGQVLHFRRPGGWRSVTNFGPRDVPLPHGTMVLASGPLREGLLPADTTAWIVPDG